MLAVVKPRIKKYINLLGYKTIIEPSVIKDNVIIKYYGLFDTKLDSDTNRNIYITKK